MIKRSFAVLGSLLLTAGCLTVIPAASASASTATCSGNGCTDKDPSDTGCWNSSAYRAASAPIKIANGTVGRVDLWYSPTCGTNWAQVWTYYPATMTAEAAYVERMSDAHYEYWYTSDNGTWTDQVYAPKVQACAQGTIWDKNAGVLISDLSAACA